MSYQHYFIFLFMFALCHSKLNAQLLSSKDKKNNDKEVSSTTNTSALNNALYFSPCHVKSNAKIIDAQCSTFHRPENPKQPAGKKIALFTIKLPSYRKTPEKDAFMMIQGGPGGSSVDLAIQSSDFLNLIRQQRDVLILDQRGTGRSQPLHCQGNNKLIHDTEQINQQIKQCLEQLKEQNIDTRFYTTTIAVQDIEALRHTAGYEQLTLYGVSYGTRVAQHYLRQHPEKTRAMILDGVVPIGMSLAGDEIARSAQDSLDALFSRCSQDETCNNTFNNLKNQFQAVQKRLARTPVSNTQAHPISAEKTTIEINEDVFLQTVRLMSYHTASRALIPLMVSQAYNQNYTSLASQAMTIMGNLSEQLSIGMHNSVVCTEDFPFARTSDKSEVFQYYLQEKMQSSIAIICQQWPQGVISQDFHQPFKSEIPLLILSGQTDPVTPPRYGEITQSMFANHSSHIIMPYHGHGIALNGCMPNLIHDFIQTLNLKTANHRCIQREIATPFFIKNTGATP